MTIFHVQSNLKHDGTEYPTGSFIEGDAGTFNQLVNDGILVEVVGAETISEAKEIVEKDAEQKKEEAEILAEKEPENTWGPKKAEESVPEEEKLQPEEKKGILGKIFGNKEESTDGQVTPETDQKDENTDGAQASENQPAPVDQAETTGDNL